MGGEGMRRREALERQFTCRTHWVHGPPPNLACRYKAYNLSSCVVLRNKPPRWNAAMGAYCLNFGGRVTQASVKNFQLVSVDNMVGCVGGWDLFFLLLGLLQRRGACPAARRCCAQLQRAACVAAP